MDSPLSTVIATVVAVVLLWAVAASFPDSAIWLVRKWFDLWSYLRTNRQEVRARLREIEWDFLERYEMEIDRGSGATRGTLRALGLITWELVRTPAIAEAADVLASRVNNDHSNAPSLIHFRIHFAFLLAERFTLSRGILLALLLPIIASSFAGLIGVLSRWQLQTSPLKLALMTASYIIIPLCMTYFSYKVFANRIGLQESLASKLWKSMPAICSFTIVCYYMFWSVSIATKVSYGLLGMGTLALEAISLLGTIGGVVAVVIKLSRVELRRAICRHHLKNALACEDRLASVEKAPRTLNCSHREDRIASLRADVLYVKSTLLDEIERLASYPVVLR